MNNMPWFRVYSEFLTDPLVRMLSFEDQRHFIAALCLKASGALDKQYPSEAIRRRVLSSLIGLSCDTDVTVTTSHFDEANRRLREMGLIDENWEPKNWDKRQYVTDHSAAERKRNQRLRDKEKSSHVDVTPPSRDSHALDTDAETDTEQRESAHKGKPKPSKRAPPEFSPDASVALAKLPNVDVEAEITKFRDWEFKTARKDWAAVWRTWVQNAADRNHYSKKHSNGEFTRIT